MPARSSASGVPDEWYDADLFSMEPEPADDEHVIALERALLSDELRADPAAMAGLLHPDWYQVGLSGRLCARADLAAIGAAIVRNAATVDASATTSAPASTPATRAGPS